jgi:alkylation response protein AidB-like acyl-CoA dehydrogenase
MVTPSTFSPAFDLRQLDDLLQRFSDWSATTYADGGYPAREMNALREAGLLSITLPGEPLDQRYGNTATLLQLLKRIGRGNLSVGRIYEGHINALHLIGCYATPTQRERWYADARAGHLFGVWNTQMHDGIHLHPKEQGSIRIIGSKSFCSGSVHVTRPLITGVLHGARGEDHGWQMAIVPLDAHQPPIDTSFWTPLGMRNSVSYKIDFTNIVIDQEELLGKPLDYNQQPHFSGGAIRFAAVQLGGALALLEEVRTYLRKLDRTSDPYQRTRVARMVTLVEGGDLWLQRAGTLTDSSKRSDEIVNYANMVRSVIAEYCTDCLRLSEHCVGARGMLHPEPFARLHTDLSMYLRQPAPDAALEAVGQYYLDDPTAHRP